MRIKKAVFPVAGLGTRFLPATKAMPKEMLPVVDKPIIQYAVEEALASGIEQIIFITGSGKGALEDHFDTNLQLETILRERDKHDLLRAIQSLVPSSCSIVYTRQHEPLGLGHAIWCARDIVGDEPFAVLLADDLIKSKIPVLKQMVKKFDRLRASMMAVIEVPKEETSRYGIIEAEQAFDGTVQVKSMVEKPNSEDAPSNLAVIGRYILTPRIFEHLGKSKKEQVVRFSLLMQWWICCRNNRSLVLNSMERGLTAVTRLVFSWPILLLAWKDLILENCCCQD